MKRFLALLLLVLVASVMAEETEESEVGELQPESRLFCGGPCIGLYGEPGVFRFLFCKWYEFPDYGQFLCTCCINQGFIG
ncbi:hypothetical protein FHG87_019881 [Trinorchestia longiramus]|nr:hypothetical protein FHG87_019881 [Trinorchestia longiramus]